MPYLLITTRNGIEHASVVFGGKHREERLGAFKYVEITDEQAGMILEALRAWHEAEARKTEGEKRVEAERLARLADILERLGRIIRETVHEGERESARELYLKYAGRPFEK